uniref:Uncharacterized protein n=1 Tax=Anguilla anguilla TaxID=7936 RepID=A0A0E9TKR0_ANGAN
MLASTHVTLKSNCPRTSLCSLKPLKMFQVPFLN